MRKLALLCLLLIVSVTTAQDTPEAPPTALMRALALIADGQETREAAPIFSFGDYSAAITSRGLEVPENWAAFEATDSSVPLTILAPTGISLMSLYASGAEFPALLGFDFFDIAQSVDAGSPPGAGQILLGTFDTEAIIAAYTARGYTVVEQDDTGALVCPADGCDSGLRSNMAARNPAILFGGSLGRSEPIFVNDGMFLNSPDLAMLESMVAAYHGEVPALADALDIQALGAVLAAYPSVSGVIAMSPVMFGALDVALTDSGETLAATLETLAENPLPPYLLAGFASVADDTNEYGLTLLVFPSAEWAEQAARSLDARMALISARTSQPFGEVLAGDGELEAAFVVADDATGLYVTVLRAMRPIPSLDDRDAGPHALFIRLLQTIYRRDSLWLVWGAPE